MAFCMIMRFILCLTGFTSAFVKFVFRVQCLLSTSVCPTCVILTYSYSLFSFIRRRSATLFYFILCTLLYPPYFPIIGPSMFLFCEIYHSSCQITATQNRQLNSSVPPRLTQYIFAISFNATSITSLMH